MFVRVYKTKHCVLRLIRQSIVLLQCWFILVFKTSQIIMFLGVLVVLSHRVPRHHSLGYVLKLKDE